MTLDTSFDTLVRINFDSDVLTAVCPKRNEKALQIVAIVENVHAVIDISTKDDVGRALGMARMIRARGGRVVAAHGRREDKLYHRSSLVEVSRHGFDQILADISNWDGHWLTHANVFEPHLTSTFSGATPVKLEDGDRDMIDEATNAIFARVGSNVEWEMKDTRNAPNCDYKVFHQAIVVSLPSTSVLTQIDLEIAAWLNTFGGSGEFLPGACLALI